ncbi:MAG: type II toxin-antitoxin system PemK/MazF family toxin [Deltaproteobacteria bacterium]|nr:type II toxin-antitoxin system PemK/MazF family toxin [Deltaproteobacteria bacterium]
MTRGSVYWVNLEDEAPPEFGKVRPGLIISNSEQNLALATLVVIPISSRGSEIWPLRLGLELPKVKRSFAVIPGVRQVSKTRLMEKIIDVSVSLLEDIEEALFTYLRD